MLRIAKNMIDTLNGLKKDELKTTNIKYKISIIIWARIVVNKHQHLNRFQDKINIMVHELKLFKDMFDPLFKKGFPFF